MAGTVKLTVQPDPWVPKDGKAFGAEFAIQAKLTAAELVGEYSGTFNGQPRKGAVHGQIEARGDLEPIAKATVKIENGLIGGNPTHNRAFLNVQLDESGKVTGGRVSNNHTSLSGTVTGGQLRVADGVLKATLTATVNEGGKVTPGRYEVEVTGPLVGNMASGTFTTKLDGKVVKTGNFWASVGK